MNNSRTKMTLSLQYMHARFQTVVMVVIVCSFFVVAFFIMKKEVTKVRGCSKLVIGNHKGHHYFLDVC